MFGCYRKGDANDPETYVAAVTMVLSRYSPDVVDAVTDPFSGLPSRKSESGWTGMPDVADVKEACEAEAAKQERFKALAKVKPVVRIALPRPPRDPKAKANHFIPQGFAGYDEAVRRHEADGVASIAWFERRACLDNVERYGIWAPFMGGGNAWPKKEFKPFSAEELLAQYPKPSGQPAAGEGTQSLHDHEDRDQRDDHPQDFHDHRRDDEPDRAEHPQNQDHTKHEHA